MEDHLNMVEIYKWGNIGEWLDYWLVRARLPAETQAVFDKYYYSYTRNFNNYIKYHYSLQVSEVQELIKKYTKPRVLEIGCGCGTESIWFALLGASVLGIDLSASRLSVARDRVQHMGKEFSMNLNVEFERKSLFDPDLESKGQFDIVWMEQTFHHLEPRERLPGTIASLLRPGGYLVISETNGWNPLLQAMLIGRRGFRTIKHYSEADDNLHLYGNERITTPFNLVKLFTRNGFNMVQKRYFRCLPNFKNVDKFAWIDSVIPNWGVPFFTHYNLVFRLS